MVAKLNVNTPAVGLVFRRLTGTLMVSAPAVTTHAPLLFVKVSVRTAGLALLVVAVVKQFGKEASGVTVTNVDVSDGRKTAAEGLMVMVVAVDKIREVATLKLLMVVTVITRGSVGVTPTVRGYVAAANVLTAATSVYALAVVTPVSVLLARVSWMLPALASLAFKRAKGIVILVPVVVAGTAHVPPLELRVIVATVAVDVVAMLQYVAVEMVTALLDPPALNTFLSAVNVRTLPCFSGLPEVYDTTNEVVGVAPTVSGATL